MSRTMLLAAFALLLLTACTPSPDKIKKALSENPDWLVELIKKHPEKIMLALEEGRQATRAETARRQEEVRQKRLTKAEMERFQPLLEDGRAVHGPPEGKLLAVEYLDLATSAVQTIEGPRNLLEREYPKELRWVTKYMPSSVFPRARELSAYLEAALMQSPEKGMRLRIEMLARHGELLTNPEKFLESAATRLKLDFRKMKKEKDSDLVRKRIESDVVEARRLGIVRPPGLLLAGVPLTEISTPDTLRGIARRALGIDPPLRTTASATESGPNKSAGKN